MSDNVLVMRISRSDTGKWQLFPELIDPNSEYVGLNLFLDDDFTPDPVAKPPLKKAVCVVNVNQREGPGLEHALVGRLNVGEEVAVLDVLVKGLNIWIRTGHRQWSAMKYENKLFLEYVL